MRRRELRAHPAAAVIMVGGFCGGAVTVPTVIVEPTTGEVVDVYAAPARSMRTVNARTGEVSPPLLMPRCDTYTADPRTGEVLELAIEL